MKSLLMLLSVGGTAVLGEERRNHGGIASTSGCGICPIERQPNLCNAADEDKENDPACFQYPENVCKTQNPTTHKNDYTYDDLRFDYHHCACVFHPTLGGPMGNDTGLALQDLSCNGFRRTICGFYIVKDYTYTNSQGNSFTMRKSKNMFDRRYEYNPFMDEMLLDLGNVRATNFTYDATPTVDLVFNYEEAWTTPPTSAEGELGVNPLTGQPEELGRIDFRCGSCQEGFVEAYIHWFINDADTASSRPYRFDNHWYVQYSYLAGWNPTAIYTEAAIQEPPTNWGPVAPWRDLDSDEYYAKQGNTLSVDLPRMRRRVPGVYGCVPDPCFNLDGTDRCYSAHRWPCHGDKTDEIPMVDQYTGLGLAIEWEAPNHGGVATFDGTNGNIWMPDFIQLTPLPYRRTDQVVYGNAEDGNRGFVPDGQVLFDDRYHQVHCGSCHCGYGPEPIRGGSEARSTDMVDNVDVFPYMLRAAEAVGFRPAGLKNTVSNVRTWQETENFCKDFTPVLCKAEAQPRIVGGQNSKVIVKGPRVFVGDKVALVPADPLMAAAPQPDCTKLNEGVPSANTNCDGQNCFVIEEITRCSGDGTASFVDCEFTTNAAQASWGEQVFVCLWDPDSNMWKRTGNGDWPLPVLPPLPPKACDLNEMPYLGGNESSSAEVDGTRVTVTGVIGDVWIGQGYGELPEGTDESLLMPDPHRVRMRFNGFSEFRIQDDGDDSDDDTDSDDAKPVLIRSSDNYWWYGTHDGDDQDDENSQPHNNGDLVQGEGKWHTIPHPWDSDADDMDDGSRPAHGVTPGGLSPDDYPGHWDCKGPSNCSYPGTSLMTWVWKCDRDYLLKMGNETDDSTASFWVWLFQDGGDIVEGDHTVSVEPGDVKFRVQTLEWPFCSAPVDQPDDFAWCAEDGDDHDDYGKDSDSDDADDCPAEYTIGDGVAFQIETDHGIPYHSDDDDDNDLFVAPMTSGKGRRLLHTGHDEDDSDDWACMDENCWTIGLGVQATLIPQSFTGQPRASPALIDEAANVGEWIPLSFDVNNHGAEDFDVYMQKSRDIMIGELDNCSNPINPSNVMPAHWFDGTLRFNPIDGGFSEWGDCSALCGEGVRHRECTNPPPRFGGAECDGDMEEMCYPSKPCPADAPSGALTISFTFNNMDKPSKSEQDAVEADFFSALYERLGLQANMFGPADVHGHGGQVTVTTYLQCGERTFACPSEANLEGYEIATAAIEAMENMEFSGTLAGRSFTPAQVGLNYTPPPAEDNTMIIVIAVVVGALVAVAVAAAAVMYRKQAAAKAADAEEAGPVEEISLTV